MCGCREEYVLKKINGQLNQIHNGRLATIHLHCDNTLFRISPAKEGNNIIVSQTSDVGLIPLTKQ